MPLESLFKLALEASWQGSLAIVIILLLRPMLGWRVPARWLSLLWVLALFRLLVPAFLLPPSPVSLQNLAVVDRPLEQAALALDRPAPIAVDSLNSRVRLQGPEEDGAVFMPVAPRHSWWRVAAFLWLAGGVSVGGGIVGGALRWRRRWHGEAGQVAAEIMQVWERCRAGTDGPRLVQTGAVSSPALLGVLRPVLLLPSRGVEDWTEEDWEHVFLHELAHFRRRDHWLQALQLVALCAHWFNPVVWLGFRALRADRELAADEWALRRLAPESAINYGRTLLKMLAAATPAGAIGILEDGAQMKLRVGRIAAFGPRRLLGSVAGLVLVLALISFGLGRQPRELPEYAGLPPAESLVIAARRGDEKAIEQLLADGLDANGVTGLRGERTPLAAAVAFHHPEVIRLLVAHGADVNLKPEMADFPLVVGLRKGWSDTTAYLRSHGAICPPEMLAAAAGDETAIQRWLAAPQSYDEVKRLGEIAAAHGHRALFSKLYDALRQLPEQRDSFPFSRGTFVTAVARGHREIIAELLERDPSLKPGDGVNRLAGVAARHPGLREWLLERGVRVPEESAGERLITAAENEDLPEIRRLLAAGVDVNFRGESEWVPLTKAATWGCPRAVKLLLEKGAKPNPPRYDYSTLALAKTPEIAEQLVAAGAKVREQDLEYPSGTGSVEMTQWFIDHGLDPAKRKDHGAALLLDTWSPGVVQLLAARGARIQARDEAQLASLLATSPTPEALEMVIAAGADVNRRNTQGFPPLAQVLMHGWPTPASQTRVLLRHGADPNAACLDGSGRTPIMFAKDAATIDALAEAGADLYAVAERGLTVVDFPYGKTRPVILAALSKYGLRDDALMQTYAAAGAGVSRLAFAAGRGRLEEMQRWHAAGIAVDQSSENGYTALHFAVRCGKVEAARWLLAHGANLNRFDAFGLTPALLASPVGSQYIRHGSVDVPEEERQAMRELFASQSADIDFRDEAGETAIMRAASQASHNHAFQVVLAAGPDLNLQRRDGMTALMLAVTSPPPKDGSVSSATPPVPPGEKPVTYSLQAYIVKLLLEKGADPSVRNAAGQTVFELARERGDRQILELLAQRARRPSP